MKISVVIPSFNRAHLLERTVGSVVRQTYKDLEIIIVDDCSEDNTYEVIQSLRNKWKKHTITYIKHPHNKGESGARNTGIRAATGEYIAFLDSDDEWHPDKLTEQAKFLSDSFYTYDGVICEYFSIPNEQKSQQEVIDFREDELKSIMILTKGSCYGIGTNLLINREKITEFFDEDLKLFADMDWLHRVLVHSKIGILHKPLSFYYKSPMRDGDHVREHALIFAAKYKNTLKKISWLKKRHFFSTLNWYIALAYEAHKKYRMAIYHYLIALWFIPFRRPGNYFHIFKLCFSFLGSKL